MTRSPLIPRTLHHGHEVSSILSPMGRGCSSILRLNGRRDSSPPRLALGALTFPFPIPSAMFLCCGVKGRGPEVLEPSQGSKPATIPHQAKVSPKMLPPRPQRWRGYWPSRPHKPPTGDSRLPAGLCWTHTASTGLILRSQSWGPCKQQPDQRSLCLYATGGGGVDAVSSTFSHPAANGEPGSDNRA